MKMPTGPKKKGADHDAPSITKVILDYALQRYDIGYDKTLAKGFLVEKGKNPKSLYLDSPQLKYELQYSAIETGELLKREQVKEVVDQLQVMCYMKGQEHTVYMRVGQCRNGDVEIDLGDDSDRRVRLCKASGTWDLISAGGQVMMNRSDRMEALPVPSPEGDWRLLLPYLNMDEDLKYLVIGYITYLLAFPRNKDVVFPVLAVNGSQGSGKTIFLNWILRGFIDPSTSGVQRFPSSLHNMAISAQSTYLLLYDNITRISDDLSDDLSAAATNTSFSTRELHTTSNEALFQIHFPVVLGGISGFIRKSDLLSRTLSVRMLPLGEDRASARTFVQDLQRDASAIYGGLLDLAASGLSRIDSITPNTPERVYDFSAWLAAMEEAMGAEGLQEMYSLNHAIAQADAVTDCAPANAIINLACCLDDEVWTGTPTELLAEMCNLIEPEALKQRDWPKNPESLGKKIDHLQGLLHTQKVWVGRTTRGSQRQYEVYRMPGCLWQRDSEEEEE
ncbi:ABC transporter ATP-binding protein [Halomonas saccharevitans]|nr:ABC transporter ATP-binding protein [Halomonas saccharevitans]